MKTEYQAQLFKEGSFEDCSDNFRKRSDAVAAANNLLATYPAGSYAIIMKLEPLALIENVMVRRTRAL